MKKLGELAKLKGDDGFDDGDLLEIFNDEVKTGLNSLMKKKETAQDAMEELMVLFAKSEGVAGTEFRTGLLDFTKNQFIKDATEINKLKRQIAIAEKTDPQLAYLLNNKLMLKLAGFEENSNRFTSLLKYGYQDLIDGESITLDDADLELYQNYLNPISKLREALSSGRSSADLDRLLGDHQGINNAGRTARNQGGNYFPPLNGVGGNFQNGNFQNNNPNARNFPQNGNFNTRTGGVQQPVYPNNYNRGNGGANWFSPSGNNAMAPNGPYNNQPYNYPPNGYNTAQPYRGTNAPYMGTPGFNNGVNQYNTYGYGFPGGGYRQPYPGYQTNFTPNGAAQYPGAPMQYGPQGGGAARPRY
jgi:hypothetical protein